MATPDERTPLVGRSNSQGEMSAKWRCCRCLFIIEPLVIIYMAAEGSVGSTVEQYIFQRAKDDIYGLNYTKNHSHVNCTPGKHHQDEAVKAKVAEWDMYRTIGENAISLLSVFFMGALCDRYGRRVALLLPPIGDILHALLFILIVKLKLSLAYTLLSFVRSVFGHTSVFLVGCYSYIADTTNDKSRSFRMTFVEILFYVSQFASNIAVGHLIKKTNFLWPFVFVIVGKILAFLYALFLVPETLRAQEEPASLERNRGRLSKVTWRTLATGFMFLIKDNGQGRRWRFWIIILVYIFFFTFYAADLFHLYILGYPFCWDSIKYGYFNAYNLVVHCVGALLCTKLLGRCLSDGWQGSLSALSGTLLFIYWFWIRTEEIMIYFIPVVGFFSFVLVPVCKSILSKLVKHEEQGSTLALHSMVQHVCSVVNSSLVYEAYRRTEHIENGRLPLLITGCLRVIGLFFMLFYTLKTRKENQERRTDIQ